MLGQLPHSPAMAALEHAAGNYARTAQFQERAAGDQRDIGQASVNREMCEKLGEVVSVVDRHNEGRHH